MSFLPNQIQKSDYKSKSYNFFTLTLLNFRYLTTIPHETLAMSYAVSHHLWRPLAAISDQQPALITAMPVTTSMTIDNNRSPLTPTSPLQMMINPTISSVMDDSNDVWLQIRGMVLRNSSESLGDLVEGNCTTCGVNGSSVWFNETDTVYMNSTWDIVSMVGTAIALGLIILATVIGKCVACMIGLSHYRCIV